MDFAKFIENNSRAIQILIVFILLGAIAYFHLGSIVVKENLADLETEGETEAGAEAGLEGEVEFAESGAEVAEFTATDDSVIKPEDLLPMSKEASEFDLAHPVPEGPLDAKNFLVAGFNMGINTVGGNNRNANVSLRSDPPIPTVETGPWNQTTITADPHRRGLDLC